MKVHTITGQSGRLVDLVLTAGQRGDVPRDERLLEPFRCGQLGAIIADAAYDSDAIRERGRKFRARVCIKPNPTRQRKRHHDKRLYKNRNRIERFFGRIKRARRIATRYE